MRTYFGFRYFNIGRKYICFFDFYLSKIFNSKKEMVNYIENKIKEDKIYEIEIKYRFIFMESNFNFEQTLSLLRLKRKEIEQLN